MDTIKFNKGQTSVIAHRGLSGIERENTAASFIAAGNRTYYGIETDIYRTLDGHFIVNHDMTLERVAGESINVEQAALSALQNVVLFDKNGTKNRLDLHICTLQNYISICKTYEKHCVIELKSNFSEEEIKRIIDIIKDFDYLNNVTFISFAYDNLVKIRNILPNHSVQYLFSTLTDQIIDTVISDRIDVDVKFTELTKENIKVFHDAGLKVNCWTVDNQGDAERLVDWGVDYITTNILE